MTFKSILKAFVALCITAALAVAMCGCDDLGAYENTEEYYDSFGDIVFINGLTRGVREYSVEEYFYNEESREGFLVGDDGVYKGVKHDNYVYIAIPFESDIDMDTLALYIQSENDVTLYLNVFVTDDIPSNWLSLADKNTGTDDSDDTADDTEGSEGTGDADGSDDTSGDADGSDEEPDDPDPESRIGELVVHLRAGQWSSFVLDVFSVGGMAQKSIQINDGQYILLQIRNNSGIRIFDEEKQAYVDPQTGIELDMAKITATNLLIRAIDVESAD